MHSQQTVIKETGTTMLDENIRTNDKFHGKIAFLRYTERLKFRSQKQLVLVRKMGHLTNRRKKKKKKKQLQNKNVSHWT